MSGQCFAPHREWAELRATEPPAEVSCCPTTNSCLKTNVNIGQRYNEQNRRPIALIGLVGLPTGRLEVSLKGVTGMQKSQEVLLPLP